MSAQKPKHHGSTGSLGSRGSRGSSLSNLLKDGVDNLEDSVTKKWLSWILRRHIQSGFGRISTDGANSLTDAALQLTRELVTEAGLDPMEIPAEQTMFEERFLFFRLSASVTFHSTHLRGLTSLARHGDACLQLDGDWLTLQTALITSEIEYGSKCTAKFLDIGPTFHLTAHIDAVMMKLKARINTTTMQVIICTAETVHVGDMTIRESGEMLRVEAGTGDAAADDASFPLTSLLAVISELFIQRCCDSLVRLLESEAVHQLQAALQRADLAEAVGSYGRSYFRNTSQPEPKLPLP